MNEMLLVGRDICAAGPNRDKRWGVKKEPAVHPDCSRTQIVFALNKNLIN